MPAKKKPLLPTPAGSLAAFVKPFGEYLRVRNFSEMTITARTHNLRTFAAWAEERGLTLALDVTLAVLERYQVYLSRRRKPNGGPLSFHSQNTHLKDLKTFFKWMARQRHLPYNPASELDLPRLGKRLPKAALNVSETEVVLSLPNITNPMGLRDRAILEVFYSTGIRRSELTGLNLSDIDFERGLLFIYQGKGKKDRYSPIGNRALLWIEKYLQEGRPRLMSMLETTALFINQDGNRIDPAYLTERIRNYLKASGLLKQGGCHLFRHTMATLMLENGADLRYIQQMLGHADIKSTEVYTHVALTHLKAIHTLAHPAKMEDTGEKSIPPPPPAGAVPGGLSLKGPYR